MVAALLVLAALGTLSSAQPPAAQDSRDAAARRAAERIAALQRESDALARQERSVLVDLRTLEVERDLRNEEFARAERDMETTRAALADTVQRAAALEHQADVQRPDVEGRLVAMYKMGRARYWRLLLDVEDLRAVGRVYRTAAAMARIDRDRLEAHRRTLEALARERETLEARARRMAQLQQEAAAARVAADRAVAARTALIASIDARRDLNAQLVSELETARQRLQGTVTQFGTDPAAAAMLPLRPFKGALAWPTKGVVVGRFGRQSASRFGSAITRTGIEISVGEGQPVQAVHEGTVAYADPFTGYGNLVILQHDPTAYSVYGYLGSIQVRRGDRVAAQATIGQSGRNLNGNPALYFELRVDGKPVDPLQWLKRQP